MSAEESIKEKTIETKLVEVEHVVVQVPGKTLGEHEVIAHLRALGHITQPAANVDVYAPGAEAIVDAARTFFQAHRSVECALALVPIAEG